MIKIEYQHCRTAAAVPSEPSSSLRETEDGGETCLEPIAGDQTSGGERTNLPMDRLFGYCTLLQRHLNA